MRAEARLLASRAIVAASLCAVFFGSDTVATANPQTWQNTVTTRPRGKFPNPRPLVATYDFGWSELVAATAQVRFAESDDHLRIDGNGGTIGLVRALWKFDTRHRAVADADTLCPISMHQVDDRRRKTVVTDLLFKNGTVERLRTDTSSKKEPEPKSYHFSGGLFDMFSALLYVRSQPLRDGDSYRIVVYPATNPYLATLSVVEHSSVVVGAGEYPAIKLDLSLKEIGKDGELEPHKKFRRASVWVSDDSDRLLLRIEASIFVGTVFAELQSVRFPNSSAAVSAPNDQESILPGRPAVQNISTVGDQSQANAAPATSPAPPASPY
jgi:hypothetical protein